MAAESEDPSGYRGERETPRSKSAGAGPEPGAGLVAFTIDTASGQIVRVESVDESGARRELTSEEKTTLARRNGRSSLQDIIEQVFEAGIASVLEDESEEAEPPETEEELKLRHLILKPMIERSIAGRLLRREVLGRAIVRTLMQDAARQSGGHREAEAPPRAGAAPSGAARRPPRGRVQH